MRMLFKTILTTSLMMLSAAQLQAAPTCQNSSDPDGDGWGWENNASCIMPTTSSGTTNTGSSNSNELTVSTLLGQCITELANAQSNGATTNNTNSGSNCVDTAPLGDGWGWNGSTSCRVTASTQQATAPVQCTTPTNTNNSGSQGGQYGTGYTDNTNTQPGCNEASDRILRLVSEGMHESEVLRLVGKPRNVLAASGSYMYWTYSDTSSHATSSPYIVFGTDDRKVNSFTVSTGSCR